MEKLFVILPAAGSGSRMGHNSNKLFMDIDGKTVIEHTLDALAAFRDSLVPSIDIVGIIVTNEQNIGSVERLAGKPDYSFIRCIIRGGATRGASVYNGILEAGKLGAQEDDKVFIHDAARCLVDTKVLTDCLNALDTHDVCVTGVPVKNTLKRVKDGIVVETPPREELFEVQTPQCFRYGILREAYGKAAAQGIEATDDTALAERIGTSVRIVPGAYSNIKITTPEDIIVARSILTGE